MRASQWFGSWAVELGNVAEIGVLRDTIAYPHMHWHLLDFQRYELLVALMTTRSSSATESPGSACATTGRKYQAASPCGQAAARRLQVELRPGRATCARRLGGHLGGLHRPLSRVLPRPEPRRDPREGGDIRCPVHRSNPNLALRELRYENNAASLLISISWPGGERGRPEGTYSPSVQARNGARASGSRRLGGPAAHRERNCFAPAYGARRPGEEPRRSCSGPRLPRFAPPGDLVTACAATAGPWTWTSTSAHSSPQGVGVTFRRGRAVALFTLWSPPGWHTDRGADRRPGGEGRGTVRLPAPGQLRNVRRDDAPERTGRRRRRSTSSTSRSGASGSTGLRAQTGVPLRPSAAGSALRSGKPLFGLRVALVAVDEEGAHAERARPSMSSRASRRPSRPPPGATPRLEHRAEDRRMRLRLPVRDEPSTASTSSPWCATKASQVAGRVRDQPDLQACRRSSSSTGSVSS